MAIRKKWTEEDINYLKENHFKKTVPELAEYLGITISSVTNKLKRLKLSYASSHDRLPLSSESDSDIQVKKPQKHPRNTRVMDQKHEADIRSKEEVAHRENAIKIFEEALGLFHQLDKQKHQGGHKQKAKDLFYDIIKNYQTEIDICYKARSYYNYLLNLEKPATTQKDIESKITEGIIYLQTNNNKEALRIFRAIAKTEPHNSYNLYCLACAYARENDIKNALKNLKESIKYDPNMRFIAQNDHDLMALYDNQDFSKLVNAK